MKHGKAPTRAQKIRIKEAGFVPENWLVVKNTAWLEIRNKHSGRIKTIFVSMEHFKIKYQTI